MQAHKNTDDEQAISPLQLKNLSTLIFFFHFLEQELEKRPGAINKTIAENEKKQALKNVDLQVRHTQKANTNKLIAGFFAASFSRSASQARQKNMPQQKSRSFGHS